ncbi:DUF421 domain-containing protein [Aquabacterium fontiphilum]|jgi:uncharacterized membrane protein YcaP (DUF421 family)|uniref:DUF421 domain-containing protein n=1 Tax=Aquabacterium fontiphilum TaxID=450365 RepID=UPI00137885D4|nr:YetF domain-containing protein [Aquabacterium fontiphilum]NBD21282.1 DUF421 domain-containing protein [Aquabacterium fontiphilum]
MFFDGWLPLGRIVVLGALAYLALVAMLRVTGKRTLSKLNAFDLVVTVALGSTLATILLSKDVALLEGVTALALLIGLQWALTWLSVRSCRVSAWIKAEPRLLFVGGRFLDDAMRRERVTADEVRAVARQHGYRDLSRVAAVVLETDGSMSVIGRSASPPQGALEGVQGGRAS